MKPNIEVDITNEVRTAVAKAVMRAGQDLIALGLSIQHEVDTAKEQSK